MNSLKVHFVPYSSRSGGALVPLEIFNQKMDRVVATPMRLDDGYTAELPPGTYLVRVLLPSGELLTSQADVSPGDTNPVDVLLEPTARSPREEFAWAYYLQSPGGDGPLRSTLNLLKSFELVDDPWPKVDDPRPKVSLFAKRDGQWKDITAPDVPQLDFSIRMEDSMALMVATLFGHYGESLWLRVGGKGIPSRVVALPPPPVGSGIPVRSLLYRNPSSGRDPLSVLVELVNPQAQALLTFLGQGKFVVASMIGRLGVDAERLLYEKFDDPIAAAVGGYYLLRASRIEQLHTWTQNLDDRFPWMADGAVIHAAHLLQQTTPDLTKARERFLEAEKRGLPLFTQGLRSLFDGLSALNRRVPSDTEVEQALLRLTPYAASADWRALLTTYYGRWPDKPAPLVSRASFTPRWDPPDQSEAVK